MHSRIIWSKTAFWLIAVCLMSSCTRYQMSVNNNVVYTPPPLFSGYKISDRALKDCVKASIIEQDVRTASALKLLACPPGDIAVLDGLFVFEGLQKLNLADNKVVDISSLSTLSMLTDINLAGNSIENVESLAALPALKRINLKANSALACSSINALQANKPKLIVLVPEHCER